MTITPNLKKGLGIAVLIISVIVELLLVTVLIGSFVFDEGGSIEDAISFLFVMGLFFFPMWWGYRLWQSGKSLDSLSLRKPPELSNIEPIKIQTRLELVEYRRILFYTIYTKPTFVFINFLSIGVLVFYLVSGNGEWFTLFLIIFTAYLPLAVLRTANSNYRSTKTLHETVTYEFNPDTIAATGESFHTTIQWKSLYGVKEIKHWFLLQTSQQMAMIIPKTAFASTVELDRFRAMANLAR